METVARNVWNPFAPKHPAVDIIFSFDDWEFEPASGELRSAGRAVARIQPQPAQLLALLLERAGEVVTREEIVDAVWPDTKVEFDQAVNYAIRHLRSALDESAADGGYIETLPRRGYRFKAEVEKRSMVAAPASNGRSGRIAWSAGLAGLLALTLWGVWPEGPGAGGDAVGGDAAGRDGPMGESSEVLDPTALVAVLALRYSEGDSLAAVESVRIAERITDHLTRSAAELVRIAGPTITGGYPVSANPRDFMRDSLGASYMVSGRISPGEADGLFLELIRISDGAHVWAMRASPSDTGAVGRAADSLTVRFRGAGPD